MAPLHASGSNTTTEKKRKSTKSASAKAKSLAKPSSKIPPLNKFLASSEKPVRDKAVASLSRFLSGGSSKTPSSSASNPTEPDADAEELPVGSLDWSAPFVVDKRLAPLEMAKLWKGIFFCFWMSDKPLVQQALADSLAGLLLDVRAKGKKGVEGEGEGEAEAEGRGRVERFRSALCYLRGFWEAMVREWEGLDRLRLDKFYLLIRRFLSSSLLLLRRESWDPHAISEYNSLLTGPGGPMYLRDSKIPNALTYHLADIFLSELNKVLLLPSPSPPVAAPLVALLDPFFHALVQAPSTVVFTRVSENVFCELLADSLPAKPTHNNKRRKLEVAKEGEGEREREFEGILGGEVKEGKGEEVGRKVCERLLEVAGSKETGEVQRRRMYALYRRWGEEI